MHLISLGGWDSIWLIRGLWIAIPSPLCHLLWLVTLCALFGPQLHLFLIYHYKFNTVINLTICHQKLVVILLWWRDCNSIFGPYYPYYLSKWSYYIRSKIDIWTKSKESRFTWKITCLLYCFKLNEWEGYWDWRGHVPMVST
jgi:hypothetical protein